VVPSELPVAGVPVGRPRAPERQGETRGEAADVTLSVYEIEDRADRAVRFLEAAVAAGLNLLVAGGTQVGNPIRCEDTR
jgi:hypothetical protein